MQTELNLWLIGGGAILGLAFGVVVQRSRFCAVAAVSNLVLMRDYRHLHALLAAVAVALAGTQFLEWGGWVAVTESTYRSARIDWAGALFGGLLFGVGAILAGGCAGRTVVRTAEGNMGALLTLLAFAVAATITHYGALAPARLRLLELTAAPVTPAESALAGLIGMPAWVFAGMVLSGCLAAVFVLGRGTRSLALIGTGGLVGALVVAGWWVTGNLARDEFAVFGSSRPTSLTFAGPLARTTSYLATANTTTHSFGITLLAGTLVGALLSALVTRSFHWTPPNATRIGHHLLGGAMMGVGAIFAGGCNIGQLSGVSTGSIKAIIALLAILAGMRLGLAWLQHVESRPEVSTTLQREQLRVAPGRELGRAHRRSTLARYGQAS